MNYMAKHKSEDVYSSFNLVMRRKPKENNFKAVLESIRDLMNEEVRELRGGSWKGDTQDFPILSSWFPARSSSPPGSMTFSLDMATRVPPTTPAWTPL